MIQTIILVIALLALAMIGLCIRILCEKNGRFGSHDVGASSAMRDRGIGCTRSQDRLAQRGNPKKINIKEL